MPLVRWIADDVDGWNEDGQDGWMDGWCERRKAYTLWEACEKDQNPKSTRRVPFRDVHVEVEVCNIPLPRLDAPTRCVRACGATATSERFETF